MFKLFNRRTMLAMKVPFRGFAAPAIRAPLQKNYYAILGIDSTATPEQIKAAYRELVKKHHPDVAESTNPSGEIFRDVMEAYGVLSQSESRANYDILRRQRPDDYTDVGEAEWTKANRPDMRGPDGNTPIKSHAAESYAAERMAELAE